MHFADLRSDRLELTEIGLYGLQDMLAYSSDPRFYRYFESGPHRDPGETQAYLEKLIRISSEPTGHYWFIRLLAEKKIIGTVGVVGIDEARAVAEIGYGLAPDHWGRGYFSETLSTVLRHLFVDRNLHRIWAKVQSDNISSIRGLANARFVREGVLREFYKDSHGTRHDAVVFSMLRREFLAASQRDSA